MLFSFYLTSSQTCLPCQHDLIRILWVTGEHQKNLLCLHKKQQYQNWKNSRKSRCRTYGWRKCSNSQARRIETELSGKPLCGLHACCCIIPSCWRALCCLSCWSTYRRRVIPIPLPFSDVSWSPRLLRVAWIWPLIASRKHRKWRDIVWRASAEYGLAAPHPAITSNDETTICIWW